MSWGGCLQARLPLERPSARESLPPKSSSQNMERCWQKFPWVNFGQRVALKTVDFLVDFSVDFFSACFPKENGPKKNPRKNALPKPNTKIHQKFQGRGVLDGEMLSVWSMGGSASQQQRRFSCHLRTQKLPRLRNGFNQERKISPKRKFLGRTARCHPGVIRADIPAQNFGQGGQNPGKASIWGEHPWPEGAVSSKPCLDRSPATFSRHHLLDTI